MNRRSFIKCFGDFSLCSLLYGVIALLFASCGSSRKSSRPTTGQASRSGIRKIERETKKNPNPNPGVGETYDDLISSTNSKTVKRFWKKEKKRWGDADKERQKEISRQGVNKRHLKMQTKETRKRIKASNREVARNRKK